MCMKIKLIKLNCNICKCNNFNYVLIVFAFVYIVPLLVLNIMIRHTNFTDSKITRVYAPVC